MSVLNSQCHLVDEMRWVCSQFQHNMADVRGGWRDQSSGETISTMTTPTSKTATAAKLIWLQYLRRRRWLGELVRLQMRDVCPIDKNDLVHRFESIWVFLWVAYESGKQWHSFEWLIGLSVVWVVLWWREWEWVWLIYLTLCVAHTLDLSPARTHFVVVVNVVRMCALSERLIVY